MRSPTAGCDPITEGSYRADDLVTRNDGQVRMQQLAVDNVQVGAADATGMNFDHDLALARMRIVEAGKFECAPRGAQHHCMHAVTPS
jgi:hypothetical protein